MLRNWVTILADVRNDPLYLYFSCKPLVLRNDKITLFISQICEISNIHLWNISFCIQPGSVELVYFHKMKQKQFGKEKKREKNTLEKFCISLTVRDENRLHTWILYCMRVIRYHMELLLSVLLYSRLQMEELQMLFVDLDCIVCSTDSGRYD